MSDVPDSELSPAQLEALRRAWDVLTEHFENVLIVAATQAPGDGEAATVTRFAWYGGYHAAIGMAESAKRYVMDKSHGAAEP